MGINELIKEYEDDFHLLIYNKYDKNVVTQHFYNYRRLIDDYHLKNNEDPIHNFSVIKKEYLQYVKK